MHSPNLSPEAGFHFPTEQAQNRSYRYGCCECSRDCTCNLALIGARVQTEAHSPMQFLDIPEVFRSPLGSPETMHIYLALRESRGSIIRRIPCAAADL